MSPSTNLVLNRRTRKSVQTTTRKVMLPVQGGAVKMDDNIALSPEPSTEPQNSDNEDRDNFEDAEDTPDSQATPETQGTPEQQLRRSNRIRKQTSEWWKTNSLLAHALATNEVPTSFKTVASTENAAFWLSGIDREHDCLMKNHTWDLINYTPGMKVLPCKYCSRPGWWGRGCEVR